MRNKKRIHNEVAYVLHQRDFSETSQIVDVFTRHHGRISLLAKGVKRPLSSFRAVLLPLQAVRIGFSLSTDKETLAVLQGVEWAGHAPMPAGASLLAGLYLNELILKLLAKEDPHPDLFDAFHQAVQSLDTRIDGVQAQVLRVFELQLLNALGTLPNLAQLANSRQTLHPDTHYQLQAGHGLRVSENENESRIDSAQNTERTSNYGLTGMHWSALAQALPLSSAQASRQALQQVLSTFSRIALRGLRIQLGEVISHCLQQYHTGSIGSDEVAMASTEHTIPPLSVAHDSKYANHGHQISNTGLESVYRLRTRQFILDLQKLQNTIPPPVGHL